LQHNSGETRQKEGKDHGCEEAVSLTGKAGALLKGSDVPAGTKTVIGEIAEVRDSPEDFGAPFIIDFKKPVCGKSAWALNVTNTDVLIEKFGHLSEQWVGKKIKLEVVLTKNPQTREKVRSLAVSTK
jgi:hypothetical protein